MLSYLTFDFRNGIGWCWLIVSFACVLQVVTAHGICHLLGYRHETEEEWTEVCMAKLNVQNTI